MSRLTELAAKATPRPWVNIPTASDAACRTLIFMADNDEATAVFGGEEHRYDADLIVALVNNLDAIQALWDAAEMDVSFCSEGEASELRRAVESLRDLLGGDHAIKDS